MGGAKQEPVCSAAIRPVTDISTVNARAGAGRHYAIVRQLPVGTSGLTVTDVMPDEAGEARDGRVFNWLLIALPDGGAGWVRDDLVTLEGDCRAVGYGLLKQPERAALLTPAKPVQPAKPEKPEVSPEMLERARKAAFAITAGFEGRGYDAYQNFDGGIVSYGRFQFTLASGSLEKVLDLYLEKASGPSPDLLRKKYLQRVRDKDQELRQDEEFKRLLLALAADPVMQAAQDAYATNTFWNTAQATSMKPRGIVTALGQAFVFDMAINHGSWGAESTYLRGAELALGVAIKSQSGENGLTEEQLLMRAAQIRRDRLYALADARGWGGLKPRADFWLERMNAGDWDLQGNSDGEVAIRPDKKVQVAKPF
ncbi:MAG TPA: chitosanase [Candidatus Limnocylindrales bacterium]|nr:chitosanase [Candidatus Limnocylindrales bacterium]